MAERPVYYISNEKVTVKNYSFEWFSGFAISQKQKSIDSLHNSLGVKLSAFNLKLNGYTLENIFQSSKVFALGGAYKDLLNVSPKDAKKDPRLRNSGELKSFDYNGEKFPLFPKTLFYDYIYIKAVVETLNNEEIQKIRNYSHFTDIEFNPQKSINTQAKSVAIIRLILDMYGSIPEFSKEEFINFHTKNVF